MLDTDEISVFVKLYLLLYADDTIIIAESPTDFQNALDGMYDYCKLWHLSVNTEKTKVVIFSKGKLRKKPTFEFDNKNLEIVDQYKYLGIIMNFTGKFNVAVRNLCEQARKAMFSLINKTRKLNLPINLQIELFESTIQPILLYGCEIWGTKNSNIVESFHLKFLKNMLKLKKSTPSLMVYGELGKTPLEIEINTRMLSFWSRILNSNKNKLSHLLYKLIYKLHVNNIYHSEWVLCIKKLLIEIGEPSLWEKQEVLNTRHFKALCKTKLKDLYIQNWFTLLKESKCCANYRSFKQSFNFEKYLTKLPTKYTIAICKFRTCNNNIPVHNHSEPDKGYQLCNNTGTADEFHFLFECEFFKNSPKNLLHRYFFRNPNSIKYEKNLTPRTKSY